MKPFQRVIIIMHCFRRFDSIFVCEYLLVLFCISKKLHQLLFFFLLFACALHLNCAGVCWFGRFYQNYYVSIPYSHLSNQQMQFNPSNSDTKKSQRSTEIKGNMKEEIRHTFWIFSFVALRKLKFLRKNCSIFRLRKFSMVLICYQLIL